MTTLSTCKQSQLETFESLSPWQFKAQRAAIQPSLSCDTTNRGFAVHHLAILRLMSVTPLVTKPVYAISRGIILHFKTSASAALNLPIS